MQTLWTVSYTHLDVYKRQIREDGPQDSAKMVEPGTVIELPGAVEENPQTECTEQPRGDAQPERTEQPQGDAQSERTEQPQEDAQSERTEQQEIKTEKPEAE